MKTKLLFGLLFIATLQFTNAQTISLIGAFNGWSADVDLTTTDNVNYTLTGWVLNADSELKFRKDYDWATAWGAVSASDWPSGIGDTTAGGGNIFALAGTYDVSFNINTGAYMFSAQTISLIGAFNGWSADVDLASTDNINYTLSGWTLAADSELKFRQDHDWATAWGAVSSTDWPTGTGDTTPGGGNIFAIAGTYDVAFNITTAAYSFTDATLSVDDFTKNIQFYYVNNALKINGYSGQASIKAYDVVGRLLYNKENVRVQNGFSQNIKLPKYQVSFILIKGENFKKSLKVVAQ